MVNVSITNSKLRSRYTFFFKFFKKGEFHEISESFLRIFPDFLYVGTGDFNNSLWLTQVGGIVQVTVFGYFVR